MAHTTLNDEGKGKGPWRRSWPSKYVFSIVRQAGTTPRARFVEVFWEWGPNNDRCRLGPGMFHSFLYMYPTNKIIHFRHYYYYTYDGVVTSTNGMHQALGAGPAGQGLSRPSTTNTIPMTYGNESGSRRTWWRWGYGAGRGSIPRPNDEWQRRQRQKDTEELAIWNGESGTCWGGARDAL